MNIVFSSLSSWKHALFTVLGIAESPLYPAHHLEHKMGGVLHIILEVSRVRERSSKAGKQVVFFGALEFGWLF